MIVITNTVSIDESEIEEKFIRASGPGGQHVNTSSTAVQIRFDAANSPNLTATVLARLKTITGNRMTSDGVIVLTSETHRSQELNRQEARDRLAALIRQATVVPKKRRPTKPSRSAKNKRTDQKKQRGAIKKNRGKVSKDSY